MNIASTISLLGAAQTVGADGGIPSVFWIVPIASIIALAFAWHFYSGMKKEEEGTDIMRKIAGHVRSGALAYLRQQYKVVAIVFVVITLFFAFLAYGLKVQNGWVPFAFITGGFFSGLAGFFGMKTATYASNRSAWAANHSLDKGLRVAFRSGAVMGLVVVGLALLDISVWFVVLNFFIEDASHAHKMVIITTTMLTFGMGASLQALFARVGGGIFTKAADVGADLVGKVEAGIPEDDPRNPATIADNVGDNVGDVAGMGADLYESYCGSILGDKRAWSRRLYDDSRSPDEGDSRPDAHRRTRRSAFDSGHLLCKSKGRRLQQRTAERAWQGRKRELRANRDSLFLDSIHT